MLFSQLAASPQLLPPDIDRKLKSVNQSEINHTEQELDTRFIHSHILLGECPDVVKRIAAYARRLMLSGTEENERKAEELEKLAAEVCESVYADRLINWGMGKRSFKILRGWKLFCLLD